jgi:hypothetical protein
MSTDCRVRAIRFALLCLSQIAVFIAVTEVRAEDLIVSGPVTISADTTFTNVVIQQGGALTADAVITVTGDMTVESGGVVTHSAYPTTSAYGPTAGLVLNVLGTLDVQSGGLIDLNVRGLRGGVSAAGQTYNASNAVVSSVGIDIGGSYGGVGGKAAVGSSYGLLETPEHLGSGGGGYNGAGGGTGGNGGGLARITAGAVIVNGTIRANGGNNATDNGGGGGSGGGIRIETGALSGAGTVQANGGNGSRYSGSGAGGRIAVYYSSSTMVDTQFQARGSNTGENLTASKGSAGTIYLFDSSQNTSRLLLENGVSTSSLNTPLRTQVSSLNELRLTSAGRLRVDANYIPSGTFAFDGPVVVSGPSYLWVEGNADVSFDGPSPSVSVSSNGDVVLVAGASVVMPTVLVTGTGSTLATGVDLEFVASGDLVLSSGGAMTVAIPATLSVPVFDGTDFRTGSQLTIRSGARLNVGSGQITVPAGFTLIKDGSFGAMGDEIADLVVSGTLRHSDYPTTSAYGPTAGLVLNVLGTLDVQSGGLIDLNVRGLRGGVSAAGQTYNASNAVVSSVGIDIGGSYGGVGGKAAVGSSYGLLETPEHLGSGGGGYNGAGGGTGGNGGGLARITAGAVIVNGTIRANGGNNATDNGGGGGSGGGIRIETGALSGAGTVQANGGNGSRYSGSGAGGRIAVYYSSSTMVDTQFQARGSNTGENLTASKGSAGTIYLFDSSQNTSRLLLENGVSTSSLNTPLRTQVSSLNELRLTSAGRLRVDANYIPSGTFAFDGPVVVSGPSYLWVEGNADVSFDGPSPSVSVSSNGDVVLVAGASVVMPTVLVTGTGSTLATGVDLEFVASGDLVLSSGGAMTVAIPATLSVPVFDGTDFRTGSQLTIRSGARLNVGSGQITVPAGFTLIKDGSFGAMGDEIADLVVSGTLRHSDYPTTSAYGPTAGLVLNVLGTLDVQSGGLIDLNVRGLRGGVSAAGQTYNASNAVVSSVGIDIGGSYGGVGGKAAVGSSYGLLETPEHLGSGGGGYNGAGGGTGGNGGGLARITAGAVIVNGTIRANGGNNATDNGGGGGSGGGIRIETGALSGAGTVQANGGNGSRYSGSGAGGRIAVYYSSSTMVDTQFQARGSNTGENLTASKGSAGTIYLFDSSQNTSRLLLENSVTVSSLATPLRTVESVLGRFVLASNVQAVLNSASPTFFVIHDPITIPSTSSLRVENGSVLTLSGGVSINAGTLSSNGTIQGNVTNTGTLLADPGHAIFAIEGDLAQPSAGAMRFTLAGTVPGTTHDQINITGTAQLAGTLQLLLSGFTPVEGNSFTLLTYSELVGRFTTELLPSLPVGLSWDLDYGPTALVAKVQGFYNALTLDPAGPTLLDVDVVSGFTRPVGPVLGLVDPFGQLQSSGAAGERRKYLLTDPGTGNSRLIDLDLETRVVSTSLPVSANVSGLAVDPFSERIYTGLSFGGPYHHIARILPKNGFVFDLGPLTFDPPYPDAGIEVLAFSPSGQLYALQSVGPAPRLWYVDLQDRTATLVGETAPSLIDLDDATFLGGQLWVMRSSDGAAAQLNTSTAATVRASTLASAGLVGLSSRPCATPSSQLVAGDNPGDAGGAIRLSWTDFPAPENLVRYDIYRAQDPCALTSTTLAPVGSVLAGAPQVFVDAVGTDYDLQFYRVDAIVTVAKRAADQLNQQLFSAPVAAAPNVVINEFEPAAGQAKRVGERVELRNLSPDPVDLTGFRLSDGVVEETLTGIIPGDGYFVYTLLVIELLAEGGTLDLLPPTGGSFVVDTVSYGSEGGAPAVPAGFTISRVEGTDSESADVVSFSISTETFGATNLVAAPDLGGSLVFNEVYHAGDASTDYFELFNPLGSTMALDAFAVSNGAAFVDTLSAGLVLRSGDIALIGPSGLAPFGRDLTSTQLYLYRITSDGLLQLVDQLGWGPGLGDATPPSAAVPNDALVRSPDGAAIYLNDAGTNWVDCGGDVTLFYGPQTPGTPNIVPGVESYVVDPEGEGDYTTIGDALVGVGEGVVLYLKPGTYTETIELVSGVSMVGLKSEGAEIILKGDGARPAVIADGVDATARLSNLTISSDTGGLVVMGSSPTLERVHFRDNKDQTGAAVRIESGAPTFVGCVFERNVARGDGGAVAVLAGSASFSDCVFVRNEAIGRGGAIYAASEATVQIEHCVLDRNGTFGPGAVVHAHGGKITLRFSAVTSSLVGAALATQGGEMQFSCGVLHGNASANTMTLGLTMANVVTEDPQFCQPLALNYAYASTSPLVELASTCGDVIGTDEGPCGPAVTSVPPTTARTEHVLHPPVPNPFNPRTELRFELARPGSVRLAVYDTRGRLVRMLVRERALDTGLHAVVWDGIDRNHRPTASGVYFARLQVDGREVTPVQRLVLLK